MNPQIQELIKVERQISDIRFVVNTIQGGRISPATFIHELEMPFEMFEEMKEANLIDIIYLGRREIDENGRSHDPIAFFTFRKEIVIVSFKNIYNREDFRTMVDRYLIIKAYGYYPLKANWVSKMNFDRKIELIQNEFNKKRKSKTLI
jgi:hypothetical protein